MPQNKPAIPTRLEVKRVYLRHYQPGDGALLFAVSQRNRDHLARYESGNALLSIQDSEGAESLAWELEQAWLEGSHYFWGVFLKESDEFVGQLYLGPTDLDLPEYVMGFIADVNHQGRGYITEASSAVLGFAFESLGAHRVVLFCNDTNLRSWKVAERCGMVREGHQRENKQNPDGSLSGTYLYGILREEYQAQEN
jgi:aminoglycoside 6'-N-acetyltransferase